MRWKAVGAMSALIVGSWTEGPQQAPAQWRLIEEWRIGGEVEGALALEDIRDLDLLPDGRLVLVDAKAQQVHILDARGKVVRTIGRRGGGPGEFERVAGVAVARDGQFVTHDSRNSRFSVFTAAGDFVRSVPIVAGGSLWQWGGYFDNQGRLAEPVSIRSTERPIGGTANAPVVTARGTERLWNATLEKADTVPLVDCGVTSAISVADATFIFDAPNPTTRNVPFLPTERSARANDGSVWANPVANEIVRRPRGECRILTTIKLDGKRTPVPASARAAQEDTVRAAAARLKVPVPDLSKIPREFWWFSALRTDNAGRLWVERDLSLTSRRFDIFSPQGTLLARANNPLRFSAFRPVLITADHVYAFEADEDDVEHLVSLRIVPG